MNTTYAEGTWVGNLGAPGVAANKTACPAGTMPGGSNSSPVASFETPVNDTDLMVNVDASSSHDPDGTITSYAWTFGDDGTATGVQAMHQYGVSGSYTITLTVTDDDGAQTTTSRLVAARVNQFVGDVNGDGRADSVVYLPGGDWYVALANTTGTGFTRDTNTWHWLSQFGVGALRAFMADVTGDARADAVVYYPSGDWYVAPANASGSGFVRDPNTWHWATGFGNQPSQQLLADVTGDHKADPVIVYPSGSWYVAPANATGTGFVINPNTWLWMTDFGNGQFHPMLSNVDGDTTGKACSR